MGGLTWLHISDWHQTAGRKDNDYYDRQLIAHMLIEDVKRRTDIHPDLEEIDFVIFSGDVTNSGQAAEYEQAVEHLFNPLMEQTGLGDYLFWRRLYVVPGNHDLYRPRLKELPPDLLDPLAGLKDPMKKREAVNRCLGKDLRGELLSPFSPFREFVAQYLKGTGQLEDRECEYQFVRRFNKHGKSIAVAGFNSAWMSYRNTDGTGRVNDYGHLAVGEPPIGNAVKDMQGDDIRIAVMHHPISWLADFDRDYVEEQLVSKFHFLLHGHQHLPRVHVIGSTIGETVNIPAGTIYNRRYAPNPRYTNSYNLVRLDFETLRGTVYLRRWKDTDRGWTEDEVYKKGRHQFVLPKSVESAKNEIYNKQVSHLIKKINLRFCESQEVTLRYEMQTQGNVPVVKQVVEQCFKVADGPPQPFTSEVTLSASDRITNLASRAGGDIHPFEACHFKINGLPLQTLKVEGNKVIYDALLGEGKATVEIKYALYMNTDDFFMLLLKRFTRFFRLSIVKDPRLDYELLKLGNIPAKRPRQDIAQSYMIFETEPGELCCPEQGVIIQWYPK